MLSRSSLLLLGGCNALYGLSAPMPRDAAIYDGLPDAPFTCPSDALPEFVHSNLVQMIAQNCVEYTHNGKLALARCPTEIAQGAPDQLMSVATLPPGAANQHYDAPRLAPDAPIASIIQTTEVGPLVQFAQLFIHYDATADAWTLLGKLPGSNIRQTSEPTTEPGAHILAMENDGVHELVDMGAFAWTDKVVRTELAIPFQAHMHLTADGLLAYWDDADGIEVATRSSIDASFTTFGKIDNTVDFTYPFITPDCGRLYFYTLQSVWIAGRAP